VYTYNIHTQPHTHSLSLSHTHLTFVEPHGAGIDDGTSEGVAD
jgi:hypothetical protein